MARSVDDEIITENATESSLNLRSRRRRQLYRLGCFITRLRSRNRNGLFHRLLIRTSVPATSKSKYNKDCNHPCETYDEERLPATHDYFLTPDAWLQNVLGPAKHGTQPEKYLLPTITAI